MDSAKSINGVFNILTDKIITLDELTRISPCNRHETIKIMSRLLSAMGLLNAWKTESIA